MTKKIRVVLAQLNFHVGDIEGNLQKHFVAAAKARDELAADVIVFPELSLIGYPPEDLLLRKSFVHDAYAALQKFNNEMRGIYCVLGHPLPSSDGLFNACSLTYNGNIIGQYFKQQLPNYGVFDEKRYFVPGELPCVASIHDVQTGLVICEDLWTPGPCRQAVDHGARLILSPNASPFETDKHEQRLSILSKRIKANKLPIVYVNHVGGQDELVFDGGSMVLDDKGTFTNFAGFHQEKLLPVDIDIHATPKIMTSHFTVPTKLERIYQTLVLGVRDYVEKNGFPSVVFGLSGGIDSALVLAIAVDALGKDRVHAVLMPSRYTADISNIDAIELAKNLDVTTENISIEPIYKQLLESLSPSFKDKKTDITEENIQARCRGILLMALSNKFGHLVLTTGNRSEMAVGYCTLYGDMVGGYAPLKDIPKTLVYELANYRNQIQPVIPQRIIDRAPSAELAPDQKDQDSLPPYSILDRILELYLNEGKNLTEIVNEGIDQEVAAKIIKLIRRNEYKRKQAAIGPHINHKSFGKDWRYPLTNGYKG